MCNLYLLVFNLFLVAVQATDGRTNEIQKLKDEFQDLHDSIITLSNAMSDMDKNQKAEIESLRKQQKQEMSAILEEFKSHRLSVDGDGNIAAESRDRSEYRIIMTNPTTC